MTDKRVLTPSDIDALIEKMVDRSDLDLGKGEIKDLRAGFVTEILPIFNAVERDPWVDGDVVSGKDSVNISIRAFYVRRDGRWRQIRTVNGADQRTYTDKAVDVFVAKGELVRAELA